MLAALAPAKRSSELLEACSTSQLVARSASCTGGISPPREASDSTQQYFLYRSHPGHSDETCRYLVSLLRNLPFSHALGEPSHVLALSHRPESDCARQHALFSPGLLHADLAAVVPATPLRRYRPFTGLEAIKYCRARWQHDGLNSTKSTSSPHHGDACQTPICPQYFPASALRTSLSHTAHQHYYPLRKLYRITSTRVDISSILPISLFRNYLAHRVGRCSLIPHAELDRGKTTFPLWYAYEVMSTIAQGSGCWCVVAHHHILSHQVINVRAC